MGKVQVKFQAMPSENQDISSVKKKVKKILNNLTENFSIETKPVAFGLEALILNLVVQDDFGGAEEVEEKIVELEEIKSIQTLDLSRQI